VAVAFRVQTANRMDSTFGEVEHILGFARPDSARIFPQGWEIDPKHSQDNTWIEVGSHTENVNLAGETLSFVWSDWCL
jgi:hypothetical protein